MKTSEYFWNALKCRLIRSKVVNIYENLTIVFQNVRNFGIFFSRNFLEKLVVFRNYFLIYENRFKFMKTSEYFWNVLKCVLIRVEVVKMYKNLTKHFRKFSKFSDVLLNLSDCLWFFMIFYGFIWFFYGFLWFLYGFLWFFYSFSWFLPRFWATRSN